ncbi:MAG: hypothetical protein D8H99_25725 [Streptococcus sp.]|nr:MAG: hypothetical protein D8H99_25725 [Streptococcus sp.]
MEQLLQEPLTLYEVYYHDAHRYKMGRQAIFTSAQETVDFLFEYKDEWFDEDNDHTDLSKDVILENAISQMYKYMTIKVITISEDGTVTW